jgi:hypothetical protein
MSRVFTLVAVFWAAVLGAQPTGVSHELVATHTGVVGTTDLTGYRTYRIYVNFTNESDFMSSLYGFSNSTDAPFGFSPDREDLAIRTDCDCYQPTFGGLLGNSSPSYIAQTHPEFEYRSFWTINLTGSEQAGVLNILATVSEPTLEEAEGVCNWVIDDGGIFTYAGEPNGKAGPQRRVLVAQITTCSASFSVQLCVQTFVKGNQDDTHYWCPEAVYTISAP